MTARRRPRRIAADEAHAWARNLRLGNPFAKLVLSMLTLYVTGEGICFVGIEQLADDTELSPDTVRRRLAWLEQVGAIVRFPQWVDGSGRRNSEARGKRTTDEVRLMIEADSEEIEANAAGRASPEGDVSPSPQQGQNSAEDSVGPAPALAQPPHCGKGLISEPEPEPEEEDSPLPPKGGEAPSALEGWDDFEQAYPAPILRQTLARQVWSALNAIERDLALSAAKGYALWISQQRKPPNVLGAHLFLKEPNAWPRYAKIVSEPSQTAVTLDPNSPEGQAVQIVHTLARASPFRVNDRIVYRRQITPQLLALNAAPPRREWAWYESRQTIGAWAEFVNAYVTVARPEFLQERNGTKGIYAPWPWPPRVDGSLCTGPPSTEPSAEDLKEFAEHG